MRRIPSYRLYLWRYLSPSRGFWSLKFPWECFSAGRMESRRGSKFDRLEELRPETSSERLHCTCIDINSPPVYTRSAPLFETLRRLRSSPKKHPDFSPGIPPRLLPRSRRRNIATPAAENGERSINFLIYIRPRVADLDLSRRPGDKFSAERVEPRVFRRIPPGRREIAGNNRIVETGPRLNRGSEGNVGETRKAKEVGR